MNSETKISFSASAIRYFIFLIPDLKSSKRTKIRTSFMLDFPKPTNRSLSAFSNYDSNQNWAFYSQHSVLHFTIEVAWPLKQIRIQTKTRSIPMIRCSKTSPQSTFHIPHCNCTYLYCNSTHSWSHYSNHSHNRSPLLFLERIFECI